MFKKIFGFMLNHIICNPGFYGVCAGGMVAGAVLGFISGAEFKNDGFFGDFFKGLPEFSSSGLLQDAILYSGVCALIVFLFGLSPLGCVVIPASAGYKGFVTGYTVSAFCSVYGSKSVVFIILGILPSVVLWLPVFLFGCVNGIKSSIYILNLLRKRQGSGTGVDMVGLSVSSAILFIGVFFARIVEIYIIPQMLNIVGGLYV